MPHAQMSYTSAASLRLRSKVLDLEISKITHLTHSFTGLTKPVVVLLN
jgi:hypothetical protein